MKFGYSKDLAGNVKNPDVLYQDYNGNLKYQVDNALNTILRNQGNPDINGLPYSGRFLELGATNDVDFPIHHTLGTELVTNGTFDTDTTSWSVSGGLGTFTSVSGVGNLVADVTVNTFASQSITTLIGDTYHISLDVSNISATKWSLRVDGVFLAANITTFGSFSYEFVATSTSTLVELVAYASETVGYDNISTKQITNPSSYLTYYDFTDGLVTLGNSVDGGSSDSALANLANGTFDTDTNWTKGTGWTISGGKANCDGTQTANSVLVQQGGILGSTLSFIVGKRYQVTFDVILSDGLLTYVEIGGGYDYTDISASGSYTRSITCSSTNNRFTINANLDFIGSVNNIVIKEILPISTKYTLNSKTVNNFITHTTPWSASDWIKINNNPNLIGKLALETTGVTKTIPELDMFMDRSGEKVLDNSFNSSANWTLKGNTSIVDGQLVIDTTIDGDYYQNAVQNIGIESGKTYYYEIDIESTTEVLWLIIDTNSSNWISFSTPGIHTGTITVTNAQDMYLEDRHSTGGVHIINSISVKEVVQDSYYMCSEKSGAYLVDSRVAYGSEIIITPDFSSSTGWVTTDTGVAITGGQLVYTSVGTTLGAYQITTRELGKYYIATFEIVSITSGGISFGNGTTRTVSGTYSEVVAGDGGAVIRIAAVGTTSAVIDNVSFREASAQEISNYAETIRTNADIQQKGIQTTAFVTDGAGVPQSYSNNFLQFNGDGRYVDTKFIPSASEDFSIEVVAYQDSTRYIFSSGSAFGENIVWLLSNPANFIIFIGTKSVTFNIPNDGLPHHIVVTYQASTKGFDISIDNSAPLSNTNLSFVSPLNSMYLGQRRDLNSTYSATMPQGYYAVYNRILSSDEKLKSYNKAKAIYQTIP